MKIAKIILIMTIILVPSAIAEASAAANVRRGLAYLEKGQLEQAEAEFHQARFKNPESPEVAYNLGTVNYRRRNYAKAADFFDQAQQRAHSDELKFNSSYNLGNALFKAGDYMGAVEAYRSSLQYRDDELARYNLGVAEEKLEKQQQDMEQEQNQNEQPDDDQKSDDGQDQQQDGDQQGDSESGKSDDQQKSGDQESGEQQRGDDSDESDESQQSQQDGEGEKSDADDRQPITDRDSENDEEGEDGQMQQDRQDVQMADQPEQEKPFEPSRRALELKHAELNQYRVEQILKEMQQREREVQLRYRNERPTEQHDPFQMDAEQLRDFFENRRRPQQPSTSDGQDW